MLKTADDISFEDALKEHFHRFGQGFRILQDGISFSIGAIQIGIG